MAPSDALLPNADLLYRLRSLPVASAALQVGAHPDDEETGMIAYLSRGLGVRTVYWSATRGEGGQNRIGPDLGEALGIVRTWESMAARSVDGGELLYGPFYDFGFAKTGEAALAKWGREDLTRELVRAIRLAQPQVVISRWAPDSGGHGHHLAVGEVVAEAFEAAGDANRFAELAADGVVPWRPQKLYFSLAGDWQPGEDAVFGQPRPELDRPGFVRVDTGVVDPVAGRTYQEQAALALNHHRTQGMAFVPDRGDHVLYYRLDRSRVAVPEREASFFDGLERELPWLAAYSPDAQPLLAPLEEAALDARHALELFRPDRPQAAGERVLDGLEALRRARAELGAVVAPEAAALDAFLARKARDYERAAAACLGLVAECLLPKHRVARGGRTTATVRLWTKPADARVELSLEAPDGWLTRRLGGGCAGGAVEATFEVELPPDAGLSSPYWLQQEREPYRYRWPDGSGHALPLDPPALHARADVELGGRRLTLTAPAASREAIVGGFRELPLEVVPPIALAPREQRIFLPQGRDAQRVQLQLVARCLAEGGAAGELRVAAPAGWTVRPEAAPLAFGAAGESQNLAVELDVPGGEAAAVYDLRYEIVGDGERYGVGIQPVWQGAPGVPRPADETTCVSEALIVTPARTRIHVLDTAFVPGLRYGYVRGADEEIARSLDRFGLDVAQLTDDDLDYANLAAYDEIVVGPNAYLLREGVRRNAPRLLEYVARGGTLVVQYQGYGYQAAFAPYPFRFNQPHDRVTFPDAPVTILDPDHPLMRLPNPITELDFERWVHDRGLYFFGDWDERYLPLLASADPGEDEKRGGLLVASYGRGMYVYAAYSFFRQIPAGVQGALQLFANLLGLPEARIRERMELVRNIDLFSFMSDEQLHGVARLMAEEWFDDGAFLAHEGELARELFLIVDGEVEVLKAARPDVPLLVAKAGDAVGELGVLVEVPRTASLRARGQVKALTMEGAHLWRLLDENRELAAGLIRLLATKIAAQP